MADDFTIKAEEIEVLQCKPGCILGGPKKEAFSCCFEGKNYLIQVQQIGGRITKISTSDDSTVNELYRLFNLLDEYQEIFNGQFIPISKMQFTGQNEDELKHAAHELTTRRLTMYQSVDFVQGAQSELIDSFSYLTEDSFGKWMELSKELDIIHAMFLYNTADIGVAIDLRCANLIELFEPMAELIGQYNAFFPTLNTEDRNTSLKMCLDAVFSWFATDIFEREFSTSKDRFLKMLVWSRNRIMHIKRNQGSDKYLSGEESLLYCVKLSLLYRRILLELLGVNYQQYKDSLKKTIAQWEHHEGVFDNFLAVKLC